MDMGPAVAQSNTDKDKAPFTSSRCFSNLIPSPHHSLSHRGTAPMLWAHPLVGTITALGQQKWFRSKFWTSFSTKVLITLNELNPVRDMASSAVTLALKSTLGASAKATCSAPKQGNDVDRGPNFTFRRSDWNDSPRTTAVN